MECFQLAGPLGFFEPLSCLCPEESFSLGAFVPLGAGLLGSMADAIDKIGCSFVSVTIELLEGSWV